MEKERLAEYLEQYHMGALNAATTPGVGTDLRHQRDSGSTHGQCLRRDGVPIASNGSGYFYAATDQEVRATIAHLTRRISGIAAASGDWIGLWSERIPHRPACRWMGVIRPEQFHVLDWRQEGLRELIVRLFPLYYERYIEVFGGGGWVLFHKPPGNDFEVYNDFNGLLVNLYRCVRDKPEELMEALRYVLNAREDFDRIRSALARDSPASDVQRAAWFYQLIRYSYASGLTSFGSQPHDMRSNFSLIEQAHRRLAKVVIENKDFEKLLHQYDRPVSFFYLDPPYHATEGYYQNIGEDGFTEADHIRLRDA